MPSSPEMARKPGIDAAHRRVIFASSLGTVFEWYDFYLYGTLAVFFSSLFCYMLQVQRLGSAIAAGAPRGARPPWRRR